MAAAKQDENEPRRLDKRDLDAIWTKPGQHFSAFSGKALLKRGADQRYGAAYGHDEDVSAYLTSEPGYTTLAPRRMIFPKPHYSIAKQFHLVECDLIEISRVARFNDGFRYILYAIEAASRMSYVEPIADKRGTSVARAFTRILDEKMEQHPDTVRTDRYEFCSYPACFAKKKMCFFF